MADGYTDFESLVSEGDALPARALIAINVLSHGLVSSTYAGTDTALWFFDGTAWVDYSKVGGYLLPQEQVWDAAVWKDANLFMCARGEPVQKLEVGAESQFSDLFDPASTYKPEAKSMAIVGEHLMMVNIEEATLGNHPDRVWWCAQGNPTLPDPDIGLQAGFRDIPGDIGELQRIFGWDYGLIFAETAMYRANYVGGDVQFDIQIVEPERGLLVSTAAVQSGRRVYYLSADGFYVTDGLTSAPVGEDKVNDYFLTRLASQAPWAVSARSDPQRRLIMFALATTGDSPDTIAVLSEETGEWTWVDEDLDVLFQDRGRGANLDVAPWDDRDLDGPTYGGLNLDSSAYAGGQRVAAAITADHKLANFSGPAYAAEFETGDLQPFSGARTYAQGVRPIVEGSSSQLKLQVGTREKLRDSINWSGDLELNGDDKFTFEAEGRYMRFRLKITDGFETAFMLQSEDDQGDLQTAGNV